MRSAVSFLHRQDFYLNIHLSVYYHRTRTTNSPDFMANPEDSLQFPTAEEMGEDTIDVNPIPEAKDLTDEEITRLLAGLDVDPFMDPDDLQEVLLRRRHAHDVVGVRKEYLLVLMFIFVSVFAFFGYKLYKSLKDRQKKQEEKKKLKQKKKK